MYWDCINFAKILLSKCSSCDCKMKSDVRKYVKVRFCMKMPAVWIVTPCGILRMGRLFIGTLNIFLFPHDGTSRIVSFISTSYQTTQHEHPEGRNPYINLSWIPAFSHKFASSFVWIWNLDLTWSEELTQHCVLWSWFGD